tara:strand:- start:7569 stop:16382 length:8814 start_codon:yes stop_codon:yes gene_type:complete
VDDAPPPRDVWDDGIDEAAEWKWAEEQLEADVSWQKQGTDAPMPESIELPKYPKAHGETLEGFVKFDDGTEQAIPFSYSDEAARYMPEYEQLSMLAPETKQAIDEVIKLIPEEYAVKKQQVADIDANIAKSIEEKGPEFVKGKQGSQNMAVTGMKKARAKLELQLRELSEGVSPEQIEIDRIVQQAEIAEESLKSARDDVLKLEKTLTEKAYATPEAKKIVADIKKLTKEAEDLSVGRYEKSTGREKEIKKLQKELDEIVKDSKFKVDEYQRATERVKQLESQKVRGVKSGTSGTDDEIIRANTIAATEDRIAKTAVKKLELEQLRDKLPARDKVVTLGDLSADDWDILMPWLKRVQYNIYRKAWEGLPKARQQQTTAFWSDSSNITSQALQKADFNVQGIEATRDLTKLRSLGGKDAGKDNIMSGVFVSHKEAAELRPSINDVVEYSIAKTEPMGQLNAHDFVEQILLQLDNNLKGLQEGIERAKDLSRPISASGVASRTVRKPPIPEGVKAMNAVQENTLSRIKQQILKTFGATEETANALQVAKGKLRDAKAGLTRARDIKRAYQNNHGGALEHARELEWGGPESGTLPQRGHTVQGTFVKRTDQAGNVHTFDLRGKIAKKLRDRHVPTVEEDGYAAYGTLPDEEGLTGLGGGWATGADQAGQRTGAELGYRGNGWIGKGYEAPHDDFVWIRRNKNGEEISRTTYKKGEEIRGGYKGKRGVNYEGLAGPVEVPFKTSHDGIIPNAFRRGVDNDPTGHFYGMKHDPALRAGYTARTARNVIDHDATIIIDPNAFKPAGMSAGDFFNRLIGTTRVTNRVIAKYAKRNTDAWKSAVPNQPDNPFPQGENMLKHVKQEGSEFSGLFPDGRGSQDTFRFARGEYLPMQSDRAASHAASMTGSLENGLVPNYAKNTDAMVLKGNSLSEGLERPVLVLKDSSPESIRWFHEWLRKHGVKNLNVAGPRNIDVNEEIVDRITREIIETLPDGPLAQGVRAPDESITQLTTPQAVTPRMRPIAEEEFSKLLPKLDDIENVVTSEHGVRILRKKGKSNGFKDIMSIIKSMDEKLNTAFWNTSWKGGNHRQSWFGPQPYKYRGAEHAARAMPDEFQTLADEAATKMGYPKGYFNSVLVNGYKNKEAIISANRENLIRTFIKKGVPEDKARALVEEARVSEGLVAHADAEDIFNLGGIKAKDTGYSPVMTVSYGGNARVNIGPQKQTWIGPEGKKLPTGRIAKELESHLITDGDIYIMSGGKFQRDLFHQIDFIDDLPRVSLTFRRVGQWEGDKRVIGALDAQEEVVVRSSFRVSARQSDLVEGKGNKDLHDFILSGDRTSTTRSQSAWEKAFGASIKSIKEGDIITMADKTGGRRQLVKITSFKRLGDKWWEDDKLVARILASEGYKDLDTFIKKAYGRPNGKPMDPRVQGNAQWPRYRMTFEKVDPNAIAYKPLIHQVPKVEQQIGKVAVLKTDVHMTPAVLKANPKTLYVFGDNVASAKIQHTGRAKTPSKTQAQIRNERNAIGVRTKNSTGRGTKDYWSDKNLGKNKAMIDEDVETILQKMSTGEFENIHFPVSKKGVLNLGTGAAQLSTRAPKTLQYLVAKMRELANMFDGGSAGQAGKSKVSSMSQQALETEWQGMGRDLKDLRRIDNVVEADDAILKRATKELEEAEALHTKTLAEADNKINKRVIDLLNDFTFEQRDGRYVATKVRATPDELNTLIKESEEIGIPFSKPRGPMRPDVPLKNREDWAKEIGEWYQNNWKTKPVKEDPITGQTTTRTEQRIINHVEDTPYWDGNLPPVEIAKNVKNEFNVLSREWKRKFTFNPKHLEGWDDIDEAMEFMSVEHAYQTLKTGKFHKPTYNKYLPKKKGEKIGASKHQGVMDEDEAIKYGWDRANNPKYSDRRKPDASRLTPDDELSQFDARLMENLIRESIKQNPKLINLLKKTGKQPIRYPVKHDQFWERNFPKVLGKIRQEFALEDVVTKTKSIDDGTYRPTSQGPRIGGGSVGWDDPIPHVNNEARAYYRQKWLESPQTADKWTQRPAAIDGDFHAPPKGSDDGVFSFTWRSFNTGRREVISAENLGDWDMTMESLIEKVSSHPELKKYTVHKVGGETHAVLLDTEITKHLMQDIMPRIKDGYMQSTMMNFSRQLNTSWSAYATVPLIAGVGFHARNHGGNWFNMALAGMRNPRYIHDAMKLQKINAFVHEHQIENFIHTYGEAIDDIIKNNKGVITMRNKRGQVVTTRLSPKDAKHLKNLNHHAVLNSSFFKDLQYDRQIFLQAGNRASTKRARNILVNNPVIKSGQKVGQAIEDNARIALYLDGIESKALNPMLASQRVRDYLFDYGDLTATELGIKNNLSRFYTFMRKNTELQARMLMESPGNVIHLQKLSEAVVESLLSPFSGGDFDPNRFRPDWLRETGYVLGGGGLVAGRFETPLVAALETVERIATIPMLLPIAHSAYPEWISRAHPATGKINYGQRIKEVTQLLSGGTLSYANWAYDEMHGRNAFTGGMLEQGGNNAVLRFVGAGIPTVTKMVSVMEKTGLMNWLEGKGIDLGVSVIADHQQIESDLKANLSPKERLYFRALGMFLGVDSYLLDDDQQMRMIGAWRTQWNKMVDELEEKGVAIPSMQELRDYGTYAEADSFLTGQFYSADPIRSAENGVSAEGRRILTEEYGIDLVQTYKNAQTDDERWDEVIASIQSVETILNKDVGDGEPKVKLSDQNIMNIVLAHPAFGFNADTLETFGIEGYRDNMWDEKNTAEQNLLESETQLGFLFDKLGISIDYAQRLRPQITDAERFWRDGVERGYSTPEIFLEWIDDMSRQTKATLFGIETIDYWNTDKFQDRQKLEEFNKKLKEDIAVATIASFVMGIRPTQEDIMHFLVYGKNRLTNSQRRALGLPIPMKVPDRVDPRSEQAVGLDTLLKLGGIQGSMPQSPPASLVPRQ